MIAKRKHHILHIRWTEATAAVCLLLFSTLGYSAYQVTTSERITAGAMTGIPPLVLRIQHVPLTAVSDVTRKIIIFTDVGEEIPPGQVGFEQRIRPDSDFGPLPSRRIRGRVFYRFIDPTSPDPFPPFSETPVIEGPDPVAAAFEVPATNIAGPVLQYRVVAERIQYQGNNIVVFSTVTLPATTTQEPDPFFSVGIQANAAQVMSLEGGRFSVDDGNPADGETYIEIPTGLLHGNTTITIDELPTNNPIVPPGLNQPIKVYRFDADTTVKGNMRIGLLYPDFEFPEGQNGIVDGTEIPEQSLAVVWWDGFAWRTLGQGISGLNTLSLENNVISMNVGSLGFFAVVAAAGPLNAQDRRPVERIVTPNGDGFSDVVNFTFGDRVDNIKVEIFDTTGHRVRTLMSQSTLQWDGRDDSGSTVESGVYIYQYSIDGTRVSGLIAVAK